MEIKNLVSIIMNCHNGGKFLEQSVNSIISQTYKNWELIFWDNKSTDSSPVILKTYNDERIKYFLATEHTSLYTARNLAAEKATGDFLAFLDVGAYGAVLSSEYNTRPLVPEIMVFNKRYEMVRSRPTYEEIFDRETMPNWE